MADIDTDSVAMHFQDAAFEKVPVRLHLGEAFEFVIHHSSLVFSRTSTPALNTEDAGAGAVPDRRRGTRMAAIRAVPRFAPRGNEAPRFLVAIEVVRARSAPSALPCRAS